MAPSLCVLAKAGSGFEDGKYMKTSALNKRAALAERLPAPSISLVEKPLVFCYYPYNFLGGVRGNYSKKGPPF